MTHKRKLLSLARTERNCGTALFCLLGLTPPYLYGAWRFLETQYEPSASFAVVLGLRLVIPALVGGFSGFFLWKHRTDLTLSSFGVALVWIGFMFGFFGAWILITGYAPSKYHSFPVPRIESVPLFVIAAVAFAIGVAMLIIRRQRSTQPPNNRWRGP